MVASGASEEEDSLVSSFSIVSKLKDRRCLVVLSRDNGRIVLTWLSSTRMLLVMEGEGGGDKTPNADL